MKHVEVIDHEYLQRAFRQLGPALNDLTVRGLEIYKMPTKDSLVHRITPPKKSRTSDSLYNVRLMPTTYVHMREGRLASQFKTEFFTDVFSPEGTKFFRGALGSKPIGDYRFITKCGLLTEMVSNFDGIIFEITPVRRPYIHDVGDSGNGVDIELLMLKEKPDFSALFDKIREKVSAIREFAKCAAEISSEERNVKYTPTERELNDNVTCLRYAISQLPVHSVPLSDGTLSNLDLLALVAVGPETLAKVSEDIASKQSPKYQRARTLAREIGDFETLFEENKDALFHIAKLSYQKMIRGSWTGLEQITKEWDFTREIPSTS